MKRVAKYFFAAVLGLCLFPMTTPADDHSASLPANGAAKKLSSVRYYDPPNDQQVNVRFTGDEVTPLPNAMCHIKKLTIETYSPNGKLEYVVRAPECIYSQFDGVANSPGHLEITTGDGNAFVECDGFQWREKDLSLVLSNNVHTVIKNGTANPLTR